MRSAARERAVGAVLAALPALVLAAAGWLKADGEAKAKGKAYDSYGEYVTDQLHRDEALLKALRDCQDAREYRTNVATAASVDVDKVLARVTEPQAQVVLDEIARREGWRENDAR
jgi:hypothetical protein